MCFPMAIPLAMAGVGTGVSMYAQKQQSKFEQQSLQQQANVLDMEAERNKVASEVRRYDRAKEMEAVIAMQQAKAARSGATMSTFSNVFADTIKKTTFENYQDRMQANAQYYNDKYSAASSRVNADMVKRSSTLNMLSTGLTFAGNATAMGMSSIGGSDGGSLVSSQPVNTKNAMANIRTSFAK